MAFVVVVHLSPDHESHIAEILGRVTPMRVQQVIERTELEADHVYVIAPGENLVTEDGHVQPAPAVGSRRPSTAIDVFFRALADAHRERAICIVLSGTGSDGALGVRHVKEMGGFSIAQVPEDAEFPPMPRAAIETGCIDLVLPVVDIGQRLVELAQRTEAGLPLADTDARNSTREDSDLPTGESPLSEILSQLRFHTRRTSFKRSTVLRRIARRMQVNRIFTSRATATSSNAKEAAPPCRTC